MKSFKKLPLIRPSIFPKKGNAVTTESTITNLPAIEDPDLTCLSLDSCQSILCNAEITDRSHEMGLNGTLDTDIIPSKKINKGGAHRNQDQPSLAPGIAQFIKPKPIQKVRNTKKVVATADPSVHNATLNDTCNTIERFLFEEMKESEVALAPGAASSQDATRLTKDNTSNHLLPNPFSLHSLSNRNINTQQNPETATMSKDCDTNTCNMQETVPESNLNVINTTFEMETKKTPPICDFCKTEFHTEQDLKSHMVIHTEKRNRYKCNLCQFERYTTIFAFD